MRKSSNLPLGLSSSARPEPTEFAEHLGRRIFAIVFGGVPGPSVLVRFREGFERLRRDADPAEMERLRHAVETVRHLGALEVAARYTHRFPLLVSAFRLLVYVAESDPANQRYFVKRRKSVLAAVAALFLGALHTAADIVVGLVILRRLNA